MPPPDAGCLRRGDRLLSGREGAPPGRYAGVHGAYSGASAPCSPSLCRGRASSPMLGRSPTAGATGSRRRGPSQAPIV